MNLVETANLRQDTRSRKILTIAPTLRW